MKDKNNTLDTLRSIFHDSCTKHGIAAGNKDTVIKNGMALFEINASGDVFPLNNSYPTVASFVIAHRGDTVKPVDSNNLTKEQLYNRLVGYAKSGNMKMYRKTREQYASCSA